MLPHVLAAKGKGDKYGHGSLGRLSPEPRVFGGVTGRGVVMVSVSPPVWVRPRFGPVFGLWVLPGHRPSVGKVERRWAKSSITSLGAVTVELRRGEIHVTKIRAESPCPPAWASEAAAVIRMLLSWHLASVSQAVR